MPGVMNSQTRSIKEQKKQLNKINFSNPTHAKLDHHSVHGKKYHRKESHPAGLGERRWSLAATRQASQQRPSSNPYAMRGARANVHSEQFPQAG